ncbi:MAG: type IV pilus twitching motility protein PilT [Planctomycetota bacterium]|jgi:twitching motility protein PilT
MRFQKLLDAARKYGASDIHVVSNAPPAFRVDGEIVLVDLPALGREEISQLVRSVASDDQQDVLRRERELCYSLVDDNGGRTRISIYYSGGQPELAVRVCQDHIGTLEELHLPAFVDSLCWFSSGLVLITGPTGMGKTTTMNYLIDRINSQRRCKIVTIEDPVEFTHEHKKSLVVQQEVHTDTISFSRALVHALRQDPDVIAIGEMRDLETMSTALTAAETGHLVLATLHTPDATQSIERIISVFPPYQQQQVRFQCASTLKAVIAQKLLPTAGGGGRALACEIVNVTMAVRSIIREGSTHKLHSVLQTGQNNQMQTMDAALLDLYLNGQITYDTAISNATYPSYIEGRCGRQKTLV